MNNLASMKICPGSERYVKLDAEVLLIWLYSPVCVGPGREYQMQIFSPRSPFIDPHSSRIRRTKSRRQWCKNELF